MVSPSQPLVVGFMRDLITSVRVEAGVQRAGGTLRVAESQPLFEDMVRRQLPALAIIDLSEQWLDLPAAAHACAAARVPVIAFGPHVDAALLRSALEAGVTYVYPRSKFLNDLPSILREVLAAPRTT